MQMKTTAPMNPAFQFNLEIIACTIHLVLPVLIFFAGWYAYHVGWFV
jgi:hypothetical protein